MNEGVPSVEPLLRVRDLHVQIGVRTLLENTTFEVEKGKLTILLGVSGGGKSTLLRILAGLEDDPATNRIQWRGELQWSPRDTFEHRGMVFQQPALLDEWSSRENLQIALDHSGHGETRSSLKQASEQSGAIIKSAEDWLSHLRVPSQVRISRLSGGQRQRLNLAQALASRPQVLFYDEPTTGLDRTTAEQVATLLRETQNEWNVTSIVVTHDYLSFLPVADRILVLDPHSKQVIDCSAETAEQLHQRLAHHLRPAETTAAPIKGDKTTWMTTGMQRGREGLEWIGKGLEDFGWGVIGLLPTWPRPYWGWRFLIHYGRLVFGMTAIVYLATAGAILGFVATYFTLRYMPYKVYSEPLLLEELLGVIGFALYRVLVPVLTTLLMAARCAAAVSADVGNKRYGGQIESLRMLRVAPERYLWPAIFWAFVLGGCLLNQIAYFAASCSSLIVHVISQPQLGPTYWQLYFHQRLSEVGSMSFQGLGWVTLKLLLCNAGIAGITYRLALRPKLAGSDVSRTITLTILWGTLWVLLVHMVIAFYEFRV